MKILKGIKAKKADVVEISCVIRKVKHDVYGKRQTAKMELLPSLFSCVYSRVKLFVFAMNVSFSRDPLATSSRQVEVVGERLLKTQKSNKKNWRNKF